MRKLTYADAGVDIHLENRSIDAMKAVLTTRRSGFGAPMTEIGHYAGLLDMGSFALAMTTDGVGSKVLIANAISKWDTVGIDCIAMNVNDLYAIGAEPIAFVDYLAVEKVDPERAAQIAIGLARGAEISNMTIVGGETASLPEIIRGFDLAGTAIGIVDKDKVVTGEKIREGDALVGVPSSGLHSNGYTLARRIIAESKYTYFDQMPGGKNSIGEELLTPTRIYPEIVELVRDCDVHGLAHITGSGLLKLRRKALARLQLIPRHQRIPVSDNGTRFGERRTRADEQQKSGNRGLDKARRIPINTKPARTGQSGSP